MIRRPIFFDNVSSSIFVSLTIKSMIDQLFSIYEYVTDMLVFKTVMQINDFTICFSRFIHIITSLYCVFFHFLYIRDTEKDCHKCIMFVFIFVIDLHCHVISLEMLTLTVPQPFPIEMVCPRSFFPTLDQHLNMRYNRKKIVLNVSTSNDIQQSTILVG